MNRKQRMQNRANARRLWNDSVICENCGKPGRHYVIDPAPHIGGDCSGWICKPEDVMRSPTREAES